MLADRLEMFFDCRLMKAVPAGVWVVSWFWANSCVLRLSRRRHDSALGLCSAA